MTMTRLDHIGLFRVGIPEDIGWGIAVYNADDTLTRTCKGCGVSATSAVDLATKRVAEAVIRHRAGCPIVLGNNTVRS